MGTAEQDGRIGSGQIDPLTCDRGVSFHLLQKGAPRLDRCTLVEDDNVISAVPGCAVVIAARQDELRTAVVPGRTMLDVAPVAVGARRAVVDDSDFTAAEVEDAALAGGGPA